MFLELLQKQILGHWGHLRSRRIRDEVNAGHFEARFPFSFEIVQTIQQWINGIIQIIFIFTIDCWNTEDKLQVVPSNAFQPITDVIYGI